MRGLGREWGAKFNVMQNVEFTLYDIRGSKIMSEIVNYKTDFFVDLGAVKKGFYIISCALNGEIITHKFVVY